jgi:hypothetical protein
MAVPAVRQFLRTTSAESLDYTDAQTFEDSVPADITGDSLSFRPYPATALTIRDVEADADLEAIYKLRKLPRNVLQFARWAFGANGIPSLAAITVTLNRNIFSDGQACVAWR